jgi:hypothetical protein
VASINNQQFRAPFSTFVSPARLSARSAAFAAGAGPKTEIEERNFTV